MALHDLDRMSPQRRKLEYLARLETNMVYVVADVLESLWVECENLNRRCGYRMKNEEVRYYKAFQTNLRKFRGATRHLDTEQQESFGRDADLTLDLLYAAITRTGTDNSKMLWFLGYIMSFPDRVGLDEVRRGSEAFEGIKDKLRNGLLKQYEPSINNVKKKENGSNQEND